MKKVNAVCSATMQQLNRIIPYSAVLAIGSWILLTSAAVGQSHFVSHFDHETGFHYVTYEGPKTGNPLEALIQREEAGMDAVFSQASFGNTPVDIRFKPDTSVVGPTSIQTSTDFNDLVALSSLDPTISMFFVDAIDWCGSFNVNIVGCAYTPGHQMVVESGFSSALQTELNSHELGHNLDLSHTGGAGLMGPSLNGDTSLTAGEVATIMMSPRVQGMAPNNFVEIQAIQVVPEPGAIWLVLVGASAMFLRRLS